MLLRVVAATAATTLFSACSQPRGSTPPQAVTPLGHEMQAVEAALREHTTLLASDAYGGRLPGTKGDSLSVSYIVRQFRRIGLKPGALNGGFEQRVPMLSRTAEATATFHAPDIEVAAHTPKDLLVLEAPLGQKVVHSEHVTFVGYGIVAPQRQRDDYQGKDVRGQTVMALIGTPPPRAADTAGGRMLPWGEEASVEGRVAAAKARGAAALVLVFDSTLTGFAFSGLAPQLGNGAVRPDTSVQGPTFTAVVLRSDRAAQAVAGAARDLAALTSQAASGARPVVLDLDVTIPTSVQIRRFRSSNVIGKLEGLDPAKRNQVVIFTAHWDHLGRDSDLEGDQIYNGAVDNAGGVAQLITIAEILTQKRTRLPRTFLFIATTGEEEGLLGASYYVAHPSYPLESTLADINLDFFLPWGKTRDVINYGPTGSTLDDVIAAAAREEHRTVTPDPAPQEQFWQRADQYRFALAGVPSTFPAPGIHYVGRSEDYGLAKLKEYADHDYHQVSDEVRSDWDWSGAAQEVAFLTRVGYLVAANSLTPRWKEKTMCPACRDQRPSQR